MAVQAGARDGLDRWALLAAAVPAIVAATIIAFTQVLFRDGDIGWHVASGRWIVEHRQIPHLDPLSYTFAGSPWTAHEWLSDVVMALAYDARGWAGLAALGAICVGLTQFGIGWQFARYVPARWAWLPGLVVGAVILPFLHTRPHLIAFPLLVLWLTLLMRAREERRAPHTAAPLVLLLWANLHGSFLIGLGIAGLFILEAWLDPLEREHRGRWLLFGLASLLASLATPQFFHGLMFPLDVSRMSSLPLIGEWARTEPSAYPFFVIATLLCWAAVLINRRHAQPLRLLMIAGLTVMGFMHLRHQSVFLLVAAMLIAPWIARSGPLPKQAPRQLLWVGVLTAALLFVRLAVPANPGDRRAYPVTALAHIPAAVAGTPVFNEYSFGGPLTMMGIAPYIDGRADMYGDAFLQHYRKIADGDLVRFDTDVRRYGICWTLFPPDWPFVSRLDLRADWQRAYADRWAVIHVRKACLATP